MGTGVRAGAAIGKRITRGNGQNAPKPRQRRRCQTGRGNVWEGVRWVEGQGGGCDVTTPPALRSRSVLRGSVEGGVPLGAFSHSANYYVVSPRNTRENHPPAEGCMINSKQHGGNVCPAHARRATFLLTIPTSAPDLPSHGKAPQVDHVAHCTPSLQSTLHYKAIAVNSTTPNVICIVLNKQHWSHKCGCQYIQYKSAPYTHHKLQRWSASGNTTHTLLPHPLPHLAWRPSCFGQSQHEVGHAPMVRRGGDGLASGCKIV